ncbi:uncharacterized protein LOC127150075 [Cucumis melo]|uniref:Uncharacterized protein LOC127150075 n=1 Tax=Cucumis melo TaxID=3656 RepID=A0ABM3KYF9_CUCME|nr:uncharacterized protein LOC127150075 [Cucumis melo]
MLHPANVAIARPIFTATQPVVEHGLCRTVAVCKRATTFDLSFIFSSLYRSRLSFPPLGVLPRRDSKLGVRKNLGWILCFMEWVLSTHISLMLISNNLWFLDARIQKWMVVRGLSVGLGYFAKFLAKLKWGKHIISRDRVIDSEWFIFKYFRYKFINVIIVRYKCDDYSYDCFMICVRNVFKYDFQFSMNSCISNSWLNPNLPSKF